GQHDFQKQSFVDILEADMGKPRHPGSKYFRGVDTGGSQLGRYAESKQQAGAAYTICHTQRTINDLCNKPDEYEEKKCAVQTYPAILIPCYQEIDKNARNHKLERQYSDCNMGSF